MAGDDSVLLSWAVCSLRDVQGAWGGGDAAGNRLRLLSCRAGRTTEAVAGPRRLLWGIRNTKALLAAFLWVSKLCVGLVEQSFILSHGPLWNFQGNVDGVEVPECVGWL